MGFEEALEIAFRTSGVSTKSLLYKDIVAVYRLHLAELLKNRPKFEKGMHCESWALNDVEKFFEELEGLLKKGDTTK